MKLQMPNYPPRHGIRVPAEEMSRLMAEFFIRVGMSREDAELIASLLVQTDLRCVFSHGTRHVPEYIHKIREGRVNPRPEIRVVVEDDNTGVLDGDGGMGHFPCYRGAEMAIARAKERGVGVVTTRNHFHFGAAGKYSRMALDHDCIGMAISSVRYTLDPEKPVLGAAGASPLSVAVPAGVQPPLVLDMGAHLLPREPEWLARFPAVFFKSLGLGAVLQVLGGILAGIYKPEFLPTDSPWESNQGAFIAVFDIGRFMPVDEFKREMDRYIGQARSMKPFPGTDQAALPGGMEWLWERENARDGIPVSPEHQEALEEVAAELDVETLFERYAHTRF